MTGPSLLDFHAHQLRASAIADDVAAERGYSSVSRPSTGDQSPKDKLKRLGIPAWARDEDARFPGLLIPVHGAKGGRVSWQYKPDRPPGDPKTGKPRKYANEQGHANVIDVHPRHTRTRDMGGSVTRIPAIQDVSEPLWITEGIKKADALTSRGYCAMALYGVFNWRSSLGTLGDWEDIELKGRLIVICFDADARDNANVARAMARLGKWLESRRAAQVVYVLPPLLPNGTQHKGVDDFFAAGGTTEALHAAMATTPPPAAKDPAADPDMIMVEALAEEALDGAWLWCPALGRGPKVSGWLRYTPGEGRWAPRTDAELAEAVRLWVKGKYDDATAVLAAAARGGAGADELRRLEGIAAQWRGAGSGSHIRTLAGMATGMMIRDVGDFDAHPDLLNCPNGVADLRTGELLDHDPGLHFTQVTRARYVPGAAHADWAKALEAIPEDTRAYLALRLGQAVTGHIPPDDGVLVSVGRGSNGKTTITYAMQGALGGYFRTISDRAVIADKSQHPTELMDFAGARLAVIEELPEDAVLNMRRVKAITGPEITARYCGQDSAPYDTSHAFVINTNTRPVVTETDHGSWRRPILVNYPYCYHEPHKFPAEPGPYDRAGESGLRERMRAGDDGRREAVLAWLVAWAALWYAGDGDKRMPMTFGAMPERLENDKRAWRAEANPMYGYAAGELAGDPAAHVMSAELAARFKDYLAAASHLPWADRTIAARLEDCCAALGWKISKRYTKRNETTAPGLSNPEYPHGWPGMPVPETGYQAWHGIRFKTGAEKAAEAEKAVATEDGQGPDQEGFRSFKTSGATHEGGPTLELADNLKLLKPSQDVPAPSPAQALPASVATVPVTVAQSNGHRPAAPPVATAPADMSPEQAELICQLLNVTCPHDPSHPPARYKARP